MKITPTLHKGINIDIESLLDWVKLESIAVDGARLEGKLGNNLGAKMHMDEDWKSYVLPDIDHSFSEQIKYVSQEIKAARSPSTETGELQITPENVDMWYGALNQARLALETEHALSILNEEDFDHFEELDEELKRAVVKSHFYLFIQSHLLQHVMC